MDPWQSSFVITSTVLVASENGCGFNSPKGVYVRVRGLQPPFSGLVFLQLKKHFVWQKHWMHLDGYWYWNTEGFIMFFLNSSTLIRERIWQSTLILPTNCWQANGTKDCCDWAASLYRCLLPSSFKIFPTCTLFCYLSWRSWHLRKLEFQLPKTQILWSHWFGQSFLNMNPGVSLMTS